MLQVAPFHFLPCCEDEVVRCPVQVLVLRDIVVAPAEVLPVDLARTFAIGQRLQGEVVRLVPHGGVLVNFDGQPVLLALAQPVSPRANPHCYCRPGLSSVDIATDGRVCRCLSPLRSCYVLTGASGRRSGSPDRLPTESVSDGQPAVW